MVAAALAQGAASTSGRKKIPAFGFLMGTIPGGIGWRVVDEAGLVLKTAVWRFFGALGRLNGEMQLLRHCGRPSGRHEEIGGVLRERGLF
jgi:hypothetical protein